LQPRPPRKSPPDVAKQPGRAQPRPPRKSPPDVAKQQGRAQPRPPRKSPPDVAKRRGRAQHRRMRQAFAGAHAGVEGEEREFTSRDEGGWESLPTSKEQATPSCL